MDLRNLKLQQKLESLLPFDQLERTYFALVQYLNSKYKYENSQTLKEDKVFYRFKKHTKLKVLRSVWIKKRNIDLFIPSLSSKLSQFGSKSFKGLAIEVDGDIHNHEFKMKRDNSKYFQLHDLEIAVYSIENSDLHKESFKSFIAQISKLPQLDSRGRKRVLRRVYISTLYAHKEEFKLKDYFTENQISMIEKIGELR